MADAVNNAIYDAMPGAWWDEHGVLNMLQTGINPARFGYFRSVLLDTLRRDPHGQRALDIGCGGGLLAEELARLGCQVTGVDPSAPTIDAARAHARQSGLPIAYQVAAGEALPFDDASFDLACCCDVLEHVRDVERVIAEMARVLRPGGVCCFDTLNRTWQSDLVVVKLLQEWPWTRVMPPNLHVWRAFIQPGELRALLLRHGMEPREMVGMSSRANALHLMRALRRLKRGAITYAELGRQARIAVSRDASIMYLGYGIRR